MMVEWRRCVLSTAASVLRWLLCFSILAFSYVALDRCFRMAFLRDSRIGGDIVDLAILDFSAFYWYLVLVCVLCGFTFVFQISSLVIELFRWWSVIHWLSMASIALSLVLLLPTAIAGFLLTAEGNFQMQHLAQIGGGPVNAFVELEGLVSKGLDSETYVEQQHLVDLMQEEYKCCGLFGPGDWLSTYTNEHWLKSVSGTNSTGWWWWSGCESQHYVCPVPHSCCTTAQPRCNQGYADGGLRDEQSVYVQGCKELFVDKLSRTVRAFAVFVSLIMVCQLVDGIYWNLKSWKAKRHALNNQIKAWKQRQINFIKQQ